MEHTKDDWYAKQFKKGCGGVYDGKWMVRFDDGKLIATINRQKNAKANALLIAACPDLLKACKATKAYLELLQKHWLEGDKDALDMGIGVVSGEDLDVAGEKAFRLSEHAIAKAEKGGDSEEH